MADQTVLNPGTGGDTIRTIDRTSDSTPITAKTQVMQIDVGGESNENLLVGVAKNTQPASYYVPVVESKDAGRTYVTFTLDQITGVATEALATMLINAGGTTSSATSYTVPTGKTLRIQSINATQVATSTAVVDSRVRLRSSTTVSSTSGILSAIDIPALPGTQAANEGNGQDLSFSDGIEIAAGSQVGISTVSTSTSCKVSVCVVGFYY